jgi:Mor family transcriptional regulator
VSKDKEDGSLFSEVADVIGAEAAEKLMGAHGGQQFVVTASPSEAMGALLGEEAAQRLCDEFAGIRLYVPVKAALDRAERNRRIVKARASGMDYAAIAKAHGVTVRTVFYVLARS